MSDTRTSLAVALEYEKTRVPRVTAIGRGEVARRIVELAETSGVPISHIPDLAAALSKIEIDQDIPIHLYRAVAEVLAYVLRIAGKVNTPRPAPRNPKAPPQARRPK
jgi:flagellar biosynthesis protein